MITVAEPVEFGADLRQVATRETTEKQIGSFGSLR